MIIVTTGTVARVTTGTVETVAPDRPSAQSDFVKGGPPRKQ